MTCGKCGGKLPEWDIWESHRENANECDGSIDSRTGRCRAYLEDALWTQTFVIAIDGEIAEVQAETADEAAHKYAKKRGIYNIQTAQDLQKWVKFLGGYGLMMDEAGNGIWHIPSELATA